jgi:hypothetical protein
MLAREGDERLSANSKAHGGQDPTAAGSPEKKKRKDKRNTVGRALRTVYDDMVREDIPKDFLDLLGKLD